jgi:hypothetical protein
MHREAGAELSLKDRAPSIHRVGAPENRTRVIAGLTPGAADRIYSRAIALA